MLSCTFFGHHDAPLSLFPLICAEIERMIVERGVTHFYVGTTGDFDCMAYHALQKVLPQYPSVKFETVLAYLPRVYDKDMEVPVFTENLLMPDGIEKVPPRFAISYRNRWMVKHADYVIAFVHRGGGAEQFVRLAERQKKPVINLQI